MCFWKQFGSVLIFRFRTSCQDAASFPGDAGGGSSGLHGRLDTPIEPVLWPTARTESWRSCLTELPGGIGGVDSPVFFSCKVNSFQFSFMRSRRAIHSSACSGRGMPSHRFSMLARVGFEMAWLEEVGAATVEAAARAITGVLVVEEVAAWRLAWERPARRAREDDRRIIFGGGGE